MMSSSTLTCVPTSTNHNRPWEGDGSVSSVWWRVKPSPSRFFSRPGFFPVVTLADGSTPIRGTYRLDPTKSPKTVDWLDSVGEDAGKTIPAIYSLNGDRFTFCAAYTGQERPTQFRTKLGGVLRVSQRVSF